MPEVRVIVVNYNGGPLLQRCLRALASQTFEDFEVVVADNASTDGSLAGAITDDRRFRFVELHANLGFAAANNRGARDCTAPLIATLNPDAFAEPDWLEKLMAASRRHAGAVMFGSTQIDAADAGKIDGSGDAFLAAGFAWRGNHGHAIGDLPPEGECFSPCAAAALYRTDAFRDAGGFDERFFCYYEDVDLAFRLRLSGGRCIQVADAVVRHVGSGLTGRRSDFVRFHSARNRVWLFVKNMPAPLLWPLLPAHLVLQVAILARAAVRGHFRPTWRGLAEALRDLSPVLRSRRQVQAGRRVSWTAIAGALTWSPLKLLRRDHDVRPAGFIRAAPDSAV